ncbi:outer membrane protein assembly factor BamC [Amphritea balenae]|uniref:Outer membrane protein assembly factor BamC n=1 Tax=Amphritea balenae TaxID=452629 RepID=A0A3P1SU97_9GAMM|nr:outer membrane protein assembly factor BamC [Amphritea balenae]RRD00618.1 outer membrane protein assembly factor BamC [Amphritea balenae]GGK69256.1 hypothetical protein GCM10007941_19290 [Amphritea balenae]
MRLISLLPLAAAVLSIAGCGSYSNPIYGENGIINDRSQNYENAQSTQRLELPPSVRNRAKPMQDNLDIPNAGLTASQRTGDFEVPRPEFFYADAGSGSVNLKREGSDKILIVDEPVGDVWVQLQDFWRFNNVDLAKTAPRDGVMETVWIDADGDELSFIDTMVKRMTFQDIEGPVSDKLRISVLPLQDDFNRTSIRMQHIRVAQDDKDRGLDWGAKAEDVDYKSDMMFEMLRYLSKSGSQAESHSLVKLRQQRDSVPQIGRDSNGMPALKITVPADQAWQQLNNAIAKTSIDVGDRDQQLGIIYMTFTTSTPFDEVEKMGFFEWLHSDRKPIKLNVGDFGSAIGIGDANASAGPSYGSKQLEQKSRSFDEDIDFDYSGSAELAEKDGFKIWFAGRVVYVFEDYKDATFNDDSGKYEHVGQYQLKMKRTANGVFLTVKTSDGYAAPEVIADEILWEIKEQI